MRHSWVVQMVFLYLCKSACAFKQSQALSLMYLGQINAQEYQFVGLAVVGECLLLP